MEVVEMNDWKILPLHWGPNTAAVQAIIGRIPTLTQEQKDELNRRWHNINVTMGFSYYWHAWSEVVDQDWDGWEEPFQKLNKDLPAAGDAIAAVALKGIISEDAYNSLMAIWESVVGSES
jgi:hypothetical protein